MPRLPGTKVRVHIWLESDDVEDIRAMYGQSIGFSKAISLMVSRSLKGIKAKAASRGRAVGQVVPTADVVEDLGLEAEVGVEA